MDVKEYKTYHEQHMMHNTGTTVEECTLLLSAIPFCVFFSCYLTSYIRKINSCIFEFFIIILPVILNCTIFSDVNHIIFLNIALLCITIIIVKIDADNLKNVLNTEYKGKKSFISNYRACTNFISAICILAVDFIVFPKRLAKTETFGFGFMDLGVGCFICSNGFVEKHFGTKGQFMKLLKTELILCALGLARVVSVKSVDYHEHISEYGVHWNFFFTLALCRFLSYFLIIFTNGAKPLWLSIMTGLIHQGLLLLGLQHWVLSNAPRDSFILANREGLVSCLGYISLFFAASAFGKFIIKNLTYEKLLKKIFLMCIIAWLGTIVSLKTVGVSRRLCNVGYIFWILALTLTELLLFLILEICLVNLRKGKDIKVFPTEPSILKSINACGLFFFIFSNLLTGFVNLIFQTLLMGKAISMIIIISYMIILCSVTYMLYLKKYIYK